jgi:type VI secretion system secreted protein VgrG
MVSYRERNNLSTGRRATIWDWAAKTRRVAARVGVLDYNYRTPTLEISGEADVDAKRGFGSVVGYGDHFLDDNEGGIIAGLRAEQLASERRLFTGTTDCARFRVGHSFELENHWDAAYDGKYLITSLEHRVGHHVAPPAPHGEEARPAVGERRYASRFEAIPLGVPFRPARETRWPRITGIINGHVEEDGDGAYAQIDDQGRYKVRMPFDKGDKKGTLASRWIRMAESYAGANYGVHYPLHKGTEVLLAHVDGNPDRPIIVGAVPNPHTQSPVTAANATQSVVQTASGTRVEYEDHQG